MKLFAILAVCVALVHAAEDAATAAPKNTGWQDASDADVKTFQKDVLRAADTMKDIKNKQCQLPKGTTLKKLGNPTDVSKHYYKTSNGNTRATYQYKFKDGSMLFAGNQNAGAKGGLWKIYCYRPSANHNVVTRGPHETNDLQAKMMTKLKTIFKSIDKDGSGTITTGGAYAGLAQVFPSYSLPNFENTLEKESIRAAGKDKVVDLDEFYCVARKLMNIQKVYAEFKSYDHDHNLKMSRNELESALIKFYFKDVAKPGLIQTAVARTQVKKVVDQIMARHDKNKDQQVSWDEFEMDAFAEEHFNLGAKCQSSATPLNGHETSVVNNLIKKFKGTKNEMSHSMWYQVTSMLTSQAMDAINGNAPAPLMGCYGQKKPTGGRTTTARKFGQNGGNKWGNWQKVTGGPVAVGGRMLLARFLQPKPQQKPTGKPNAQQKEIMTVKQAIQALRKQADTNHDGKISDREIYDIFQGVRNHLSASDFGRFLDMVNKLKGPVNCGKSNNCGSCTARGMAGLCGWFQEAAGGAGGFGGFSKSSGTCKFVDRSLKTHNSDSAKPNTCQTQCKKQGNVRGPRL